MRYIIGVLFIIFSLNYAKAQDFETVDQQLIWLGAKVNFSLKNDWKVGAFVEERRFIFPDREQQRVIPDVYFIKKINPKWTINGGLWVFTIFTPGNPFDETAVALHEWRPYFTVDRTVDMNKGKLKLAVKSEWRMFLSPNSENHFDGPIENQVLRERFKIGYALPINERQKLVFAEELHLNFYSNVDYFDLKVFDQNRVTIDLVSKISEHIDLKTGYLHWFQPTGNPATYFSRHIAVVEVVFNL